VIARNALRIYAYINYCVFLYIETLIVQPKTKEQLIALKTVIKALKIEFKSEKNPYNPEFTEKILQGREYIKNGKGVKIDTKDLWK
jgi:hypothetical protein